VIGGCLHPPESGLQDAESFCLIVCIDAGAWLWETKWWRFLRARLTGCKRLTN
jgi:hypothetical protein